MKVVAFGASISKQSINQQLAIWAAMQSNADVVEIDLNDFEMPIFSVDREREGIPPKAKKFKSILNDADGIIISFAEHNGSYSAAFKNIFDWMSRVEKPIWSNKPMFLMATSPGARGGINVLNSASASFPHQGAQVAAIFSLPSFSQHFNKLSGITDQTMKDNFNRELNKFNKLLVETATKKTTSSA